MGFHRELRKKKYLVIYHERLELAFMTLFVFSSYSQVRHLDTSEKSELHKLQQLKDEQGVLLCVQAALF